VQLRTFVLARVEICREHRVRLVIPLDDLELTVLAYSRQQFLDMGPIPVVSSPNVVDICLDKLATADFLQSHGVRIPETYSTLEDTKEALDVGRIAFPSVAKPR
jgi:carbamoyl-phosphate synthase large subunit